MLQRPVEPATDSSHYQQCLYSYTRLDIVERNFLHQATELFKNTNLSNVVYFLACETVSRYISLYS